MSMPGTIGGAKIVFKNQMMMTKVGIVGAGFVGSAIAEAMDRGFCGLTIVDPAKGYNNTYHDLLDCDGVFVCVPSPQSDDGTCDTSPSPMDKIVYRLKTSIADSLRWKTPMRKPPTTLITAMRIAAMASPRTNFDEPSMAP